MIRAIIRKSPDGYAGFEITGHAGHSDKGQDIVCAAVSVLCINCVNSVEELAGDETEVSEADGHLICRFPAGLTASGKLLVDSMICGLTAVAESYNGEPGGPFIETVFEED